MPLFRLAAILVFVFFQFAVVAEPVAAQESSRPFSYIVSDWDRTLDNAEAYVDGPSHFAERSRDFRLQIAALRAEAIGASANASAAIKGRTALLDALGPPPGEGDAPENEQIAKQRESYLADIAFYRARVSHAEVAIARADALDSAISELSRAELLNRLTASNPLPLAPATIAVALPNLVEGLIAIAESPVIWWRSLPPDQRVPGVFSKLVLFLLGAFLLGWALRFGALRFFGRDPAVEDPTYARRLLGAVADGFARGIFPAAILLVILVRLQSGNSIIFGPFATVLEAVCKALALLVLAWAVPRAALAPGLPNWRLTDLTPEGAKAISRRIVILASIAAIDGFLVTAAKGMDSSFSISTELRFFYDGFFQVAESIAFLTILQPRLWRREGDAGAAAAETDTEGSTQSSPHRRFWKILRGCFAVLALAAIVASLIGYGELGHYLIKNLMATGLLGGVIYLLRGLFREFVGIGLRTHFVHSRLAIRHRTRQIAKFWLRVLLDIVIFLVTVFALAPVWGVPPADLSHIATSLFQGFTVGSVTISLVDFSVGIAIFVTVILISRALKRTLAEQVLPETEIDIGLQNSISAGFGYLGFIIAAMLGVSALGLDLSNIALIAGALSVGIGFGLQTIVSNFVAGLTLLIERPIKVGDWVVVGEQEGIVKRIQVRATEIETFERTSVIVPNSAFLQENVINRTHKDSNSRIRIPIGVAYGTDVRKVEQILLAIAKENSKVAAWPEPYVLFLNFGDSSLDLELRCYCANVFDTLRAASDIRFAIDEAFRSEGIEIPFPQRDVNLKGLEALAERRTPDKSDSTK